MFELPVKIERVPETDRVRDWGYFEKRINDLMENGYAIIGTNPKYVTLQRKSMPKK